MLCDKALVGCLMSATCKSKVLQISLATAPQEVPWDAGASLGTITAYASAPFITKQYEWPAVFTIYGLVGFVWTLLWSLVVTEKPWMGVHEEKTREQEDTVADIPWTAFARCLPLWAIIIVETMSGK